jgi:hypothetical protein
MIDYIIGLAFFPFSVVIFLKLFGVVNFDSIIGIPIMLIAAVGLIVVQVFNILSAHINKEYIMTSWILCAVMMWPALIYLTSSFITYPAAVISSLPAIIASFLFVEGIYSFYIDHESVK